jgi:hypothetical protein
MPTMVPRGDHLMVLSKTLKTYEQTYACVRTRTRTRIPAHAHAHTHAHAHWQLVEADSAWEGWCAAVCVPTFSNTDRAS